MIYWGLSFYALNCTNPRAKEEKRDTTTRLSGEWCWMLKYLAIKDRNTIPIIYYLLKVSSIIQPKRDRENEEKEDVFRHEGKEVYKYDALWSVGGPLDVDA